MIVRLATSDDNPGLLELTRKTPMKGGLQLRIDREPDFFDILQRRGDYRSFVIEEKGMIIGCWSVVIHPVYINGEKKTIYYLRDLKLDPEYQGSTAIYRMFKYVSEYQRSRDADIHLTIVLHGNERVMSMLGGRAGLSEFASAGLFFLKFCVLRGRNVTFPRHRLEEHPALDELAAFYDRFYRGYQFGPVVTERQLGKMKNIALMQEGKMVAAITLEDPIDYRKTVMVKYSWLFKTLILGMNVLSKLRIMAKPPFEGDTIRILYVKYLAFTGDVEVVNKLLAWAIDFGYKGGYHFLCIGSHEKDPLCRPVLKLLGLKVDVHAYVSSLKGDKQAIESIVKGALFEDHPLT